MHPRWHRAYAALMRTRNQPPASVSREEFEQELGAQVAVLPHTTCLLGWSETRSEWLVHGFVAGGGHSRERLDPLARFLDHHVRPHLDPGSFWFFFNHWDAWREGAEFSSDYHWVSATTGIGSVEEWQLGPGEIPILSHSRSWIACYGAQLGDPSALLVPEAHYLCRLYYRPLFARMTLERARWHSKRPEAIFAGRDHGPTVAGTTIRRRLKTAVEAEHLAVEVHLEGGVPRRAQIGYKYLLDLDGWARTWDAWAWKLASGSVVLSPDSDWTTFFTGFFEPWIHFVPVDGDFSNLAERLEWCGSHDRECQEIAARARARVREVYRPTWAGAELARQLQARRQEGPPLPQAAAPPTRPD